MKISNNLSPHERGGEGEGSARPSTSKLSLSKKSRVQSMIIHEKTEESSPEMIKDNLCCSFRLLVAMLLGMSTLILYAQRQTLNISIFCMVNADSSELHQDELAINTTCRNLNLSSTVNLKFKSGPFLWNKEKQGLILGSFYWGYCFQLFGGFFAAKIGSKHAIALAVLVSSLCTILIPFVSDVTDSFQSYQVLVVLRVITGLAQGFVFPAALPLIAKWSAKSEKSILWSFFMAGTSLGIILSTFLSGPICATGYWQFNFIIYGSLGFIWLLPWLKFAESTPTRSNKIQNRELAYLRVNSDSSKSRNIEGMSPFKWPIIEILTSRSVWVIVCTNVLSDFTLYGILSVLPAYLAEVYGVDVLLNSYLSAGQYFFLLLCTIMFAFLADTSIKRKWLSTLNTRKLSNSIGMLIPACIFPVIAYLTCYQFNLIIGLLVLAAGLPGAYLSAGYPLNAADVAGPFSGIVFGLSNSFGSLSGIAAPYVAHSVTKHSSMNEWRVCLILFSCALFLGGLIFALFAKGELEPWASVSYIEQARRKKSSKVDLVTSEIDQDQRHEEESGDEKSPNGIVDEINDSFETNNSRQFHKSVLVRIENSKGFNPEVQNL